MWKIVNYFQEHILLRQIAALAYTALLTLLLLQSSGRPVIGQAAPPGPPDMARETLLTCGHIIGFSLLVLLWWWVFSAISTSSHHALVLTIVIALVLGCLTELLQTLVPDRSASWSDLAVNILVTLGAAWLVHARSGRMAH